MIEIKNLRAGYRNEKVLDNLDLSLKSGKVYALIGPSGCGKSTLLKLICGIIKPESGEILFKGKQRNKYSINIAYVPQNYGLLEWKNIEKNIFLPLGLKSRNNRKNTSDRDKNINIIKKLGLSSLLKKYPKELSGGQKQRVALARAFIGKPDLLLMDEPFSALDAFTAQDSQNLFLDLHKKWGTTTLFITHNINEAIKVGEEILIMSQNSKKISHKLENHLKTVEYKDKDSLLKEKVKFKEEIREKLKISSKAC